MWNKVEKYIKKHKLLETGKLYIVALSGGADSVSLLLLLKEAGFNVHAAHCNFRLRGAESDRDEQFCDVLCQKLEVPLHRIHFDTQLYAEVHKVSIEMAARELRYRWFEELRKDIGAEGICVAHHRDDSVETVLLNLVRGTGLRGLTGIQPRNGHVLRPLLCVSRAEIEQYLTERHQNYVTDCTNLETDVLRNKIRLQVLPLLQTLNPAVSDNVLRTAEHLKEAQLVLDGIMENLKRYKQLEFNVLEKYHSSEYIVYEWLKNYGFKGQQTAQILTAKTGSIFTSPTGYDLLVDRDRFEVEPTMKPLKTMRVPEPGTYVMDDGTRVKVSEEPVNQSFRPSKAPDSVTLDASKVVFPLLVRRVTTGDWMIPFGMKGRKLLSDLMTDLKLSMFEKRRQLVVVDAQDKIVWLVGIRTDQRCRVGAETQKVCRLSVEFI